MGLPSQSLIHCTLGGSLPGDIWRVNTWFRPDTLVEANLTQSQLDTFADLVLSTFSTKAWNPATNPLKGKNVAAVTLSSIQATAYNAGAAYQSSKRSITAVVGTGSAASNPAYAAVCCTLLTDVNSRRTRGRMYVPATAVPCSSTDLQIGQGDIDVVVGRVKDYLTQMDLQTWPTGTAAVQGCVVSRIGSGASHGIQVIRADSLMDTQRGRESKVTALRFSSATV